MFETHASWQYDFPSPFKDPGMQHWVAVTMAVQVPCYLLVNRTVAVEGAGAEELSGPPRTTLVADEQMLQHLLQSIRPDLLLTLHVLLPGRGEGRWGVWRTERVREVWQPAEAEQRQGTKLVLKLWDGLTWYDPNREAVVEGHVADRQRLARFVAVD